MKKLLTLMLALVVVPSAVAALSLDVTVGGLEYDGAMLPIGTEVSVAVIQDAPNVDGSGGEVYVNFVGDPISIVDTTPQFSMTTYEGWDWTFNAGVAWVGSTAWKGAAAKPGVGTPGIGSVLGMAGPYVSTWEFTFAATETFDLSFGGNWDGVFFQAAPVETVNVIPEPMSMLLLGIGGLFLRRRK